MTLNRRIGLGFTLAADPTGGTSFSTLAAIVDGWDEEDAKAETPDTAILADLYKTFGKSQIDPGGITFEIAYDPDHATTTTLITMFKSVSQVAPNWQIGYPGGDSGAGSVVAESFKAHCVGMGRSVKKGKLLVCKITLKKTGQPGFNGD